jgi:hypothetical protein
MTCASFRSRWRIALDPAVLPIGNPAPAGVRNDYIVRLAPTLLLLQLMMSKHLLLSVLSAAFIAVSLAACSSGDGDPSTGDDQDVSEGKTCGGIAGIRCKSGLKCELSSNIPDATGKCVKSSTQGCTGIPECPAPPNGCHYGPPGCSSGHAVCGQLECQR